MVGGLICFSLQHNDTKKHVHAMHVSCFNKRAANNENLLFSVKLQYRHVLLSMLSYARSYKIITMFNMLKDSPKFFLPMSFLVVRQSFPL